MKRRWWLIGGAFLIALTGAGLYVRRPRIEAELARTNGVVPSAPVAAEVAPPPRDSSAPAGSPTLLADAPLTEQTFGVEAELIPDFRDLTQADVVSVQPPPSGLSPIELRPRIEAESTQCQSKVVSACIAELKDCAEAAGQQGSPWQHKPTSRAAQELQRTLRKSGPEAGALRREIAKGGGNLLPSAAMAAVELDLAHEPERLAAESAITAACRNGDAEAQLPKACEGGSLAACDALMNRPNVEPSGGVSVERACDVGSRKACLLLAHSLGKTSVAGEAARLRSLELAHCSDAQACPAHSRQALETTAQNTLRAGINRVCVNQGVMACAQLAAELYRNPELEALGQGYACRLGEENACRTVAMMYSEGRGVERDPKLALAFLERGRKKNADPVPGADVACDSELCRALHSLAQGAAAPEEADEPMMRAELAPEQSAERCDAGELTACLGLVMAYQSGHHPDADRAETYRGKAAALLDVDCNKGNLGSCAAAKAMRSVTR